MKESFLHFLWRWRRFDARHLQTTQGEIITILHPGDWNHDAGPDFFNARLQLGETTWAGNVEIHVRASEWQAHGHNIDPAYDNVVLHVVLEEDQAVFRTNGDRIPCLELKGRIPEAVLAQYELLETERDAIPCRQFWHKTPEIIRLNWLDRMLVERLEQKTEQVAEWLTGTQMHWEEAFFRSVARNFGLKVNMEPFEALARSLPLRVLTRHRNNLFQLEALLFGQAGLLEVEFVESYPTELRREYRLLRHKYQLTPLDAAQWKFLRLRPANFPSVRIAQLAALIHRTEHLFSQVLDANNLREIEHLFETRLEGYWLDHYQFDKPSGKRPKNLGRDFIHLFVVNSVAPFLFHWGKTKKQELYAKKALALLEEIPPETNSVLEQWVQLGEKPKNAFQTQALLQLNTKWCSAKRCLQCAVGNAVLK